MSEAEIEGLASSLGFRRTTKVSIVVPLFGLTKSILRIPKGNPKKELQWTIGTIDCGLWFRAQGLRQKGIWGYLGIPNPALLGARPEGFGIITVLGLLTK